MPTSPDSGSVTSKTGKSTARRAWFEVRDYTQREIESREALVHALQSDVIAGLVSVRDTQTRIRNRIQEDLKNATDVSDCLQRRLLTISDVQGICLLQGAQA